MRARSPGRLGVPWLSTDWLAHELIRADGAITKAIDENGGAMSPRIEHLVEYRHVIREARSALLRGWETPDLQRCPICHRLVDHDLYRRAARCPYCRADLFEEAPHYERSE